MYSIKKNVNNEIIIKNSKFISFLYKINNINDIDILLNKIKKDYPNANHYCYAYILDNNKKCSDDFEPSGTAGIPILKVLEFNKLNNILCIVVRYFGGIKLGSNGLIRAYNKCVCNVIDKSIIIKLEKGYNIDLTFNYDNIKNVDYLLKKDIIMHKSFNDLIIYNLNVNKFRLNELKQINFINIKINHELNVEKEENNE